MGSGPGKGGVLSALLLTVFGVLGGCVKTVGVDQVVVLFNDAAFQSSVGGHPMSGEVMAQSPYAQNRLRKWLTPVNISIAGDPPAPMIDLVRASVRDIEAETNLQITFSETANDTANFQVLFSRDAGFVINKTENVKCYASVRDDEGRITKAEIRIDLHDNPRAKECVIHEMLHGFGLLHTNNLPSAVNYRYRLQGLTEWDRIVLRTLYDPRMKAGAKRFEALPVARPIISHEFRKMK